MNRAEFWIALDQLDLDRFWVHLDGLPPTSDVYALEHVGQRWTTYYFERGEHVDERWFETEGAALTALLDMLREDVAVEPRMRRSSTDSFE